MTLRAETRARARAVQLLYAWELRGRPSVQDVLESTRPLLIARPRVTDLAERLFRSAARRADESDTDIAAVAEHWRLERLGTIERTIMRVALAELATGDTPAKVVIDEAVRLAHWFAGPQAPGFINGVLDAGARAAGRL